MKSKIKRKEDNFIINQGKTTDDKNAKKGKIDPP